MAKKEKVSIEDGELKQRRKKAEKTGWTNPKRHEGKSADRKHGKPGDAHDEARGKKSQKPTAPKAKKTKKTTKR